MRRIPIPSYDVSLALTLCASNLRDRGLMLRLLGSLQELQNAETEYRDKGPRSQLYSIAETQSVGDWVDGSEMVNLYKKTFSRKNGPTRHIYDALILLAPGKICPMCNQRTVSTLDHYLAKSHHPSLSITPINLVPSCKDCNGDSLVRRPRRIEEQTLHPYFDSVDDDIWLMGHLVEDTPPVVTFEVDAPTEWSVEKQEMVRTHFRTFGLGKLYTTHAAGELVNVFYDVSNFSENGSAPAIRAHLAQRASNRRHVVRNSWQAAMYQCLADSDWYCDGGYAAIVGQ